MNANASKRIVYIDMDNTLVDFGAKLTGIHPPLLVAYEGRVDEIPGIFALMPPMAGAIEAVSELSELFDVYLLSTAPWENPSAWQHKVEWVHLHLGRSADSPAYKRLILSHHKNLNRGDFLIDDRPGHRGADRFEGEVIPFGGEGFEGWPQVVAYLRKRVTVEDEKRAERLATTGTSRPGADVDAAFARATAALEASEVYPMFSPEYRAAVQHALQEFKRAAAVAGTTTDQTEFADIADRLALYLGIDWTLIDVIEVRRADGSTELVDFRTDPDAARQLYGVTAFRIVEARDGD
jgi:hypothetical protein